MRGKRSLYTAFDDLVKTRKVTFMPNFDLPEGSLGVEYDKTLQAASNTPVIWSIDAGYLPPGLALDADTGEISGTPTADGTFGFTVTAENDDGIAERELSISVTSIDRVAIFYEIVRAAEEVHFQANYTPESWWAMWYALFVAHNTVYYQPEVSQEHFEMVINNLIEAINNLVPIY